MVAIREIVLGVAINLISGCIGYVIRIAVENRSRLRLFSETLVRRNELVRVSAAYLFRIMVNGKYLLIRGGRIGTQYQPVGGVYKRFSSGESALNILAVSPDNSVKSVATDADDLRVCLPRKNLLKFAHWFDSRQGREVDHCREFYEELGPLGVLSSDDCSTFKPEFIRQCDRRLSHSQHFDINELLLHDVYEIRLSSESQRLVGEYVQSNPGGTLVLVDGEDIDRGTCYVNGTLCTIADTARAVK